MLTAPTYSRCSFSLSSLVGPVATQVKRPKSDEDAGSLSSAKKKACSSNSSRTYDASIYHLSEKFERAAVCTDPIMLRRACCTSSCVALRTPHPLSPASGARAALRVGGAVIFPHSNFDPVSLSESPKELRNSSRCEKENGSLGL